MNNVPTKEEIAAMHRAIQPKKKHLGVTIGMAMNNATHLVIATVKPGDAPSREELAKEVLDMTEAILDEMTKRDL